MIILNIFTAGTLVVVVFVMKALATGEHTLFIIFFKAKFKHANL